MAPRARTGRRRPPATSRNQGSPRRSRMCWIVGRLEARHAEVEIGESLDSGERGRQDGHGPRRLPVPAGNIELSLTKTLEGQQVELRIVDKTLYVKIPPAEASRFGTDKPWLKITPGADDPLSQAMSGSMGSTSQASDPTELLDRVAEAGRIVSSDQTTLDGEKVNHDKVELDLDKILDKFTALMPAATKAKLEQQVKGKHIMLPTELWVDKNQLPRQITMDETALTQAEGTGGAGLGKSTLEYSDWGAPVTITAPPADQIADMSEIVKKMGG
ncbi:hypothetical protein AB0383_40110 [Amycolatopsis sp. NPDC051373]|uniref:hypothetical protein n=2 Tax=unclassified Amycolatopsis TaxID=2618356 RepID=UPI00344C46BD